MGCPRYPHFVRRDVSCPHVFRLESTDFCGKVSYYNKEDIFEGTFLPLVKGSL